MKLCLIEWVDSYAVYGWHHLSSNDSVSKCVSVGIVVRENEKEIVCTMSKAISEDVETTMAIPKVAITRMRKLVVKRG